MSPQTDEGGGIAGASRVKGGRGGAAARGRHGAVRPVAVSVPWRGELGCGGAAPSYHATQRLAVLDALAAVFLLLRRRAGLVLGCAVLVTDAAANGYANCAIDASAGQTGGRVGHAVITLLALVLRAVTTPP